jgi:putative oxidoreductase
MTDERRRAATDWVYTGLRVVSAWAYLQHGTVKLFNWPAPFGSDHLSTLFAVGGFIEVVGGTLILLGLGTRVAAFICSGEMAVVYFMFHAPHGFLLTSQNHGETPAILAFLFLYFSLIGPGPYSLDAVLSRARERRAARSGAKS